MSEKKVLIITYYWPPSGGSGVQRWLKFVKYLPTFGWKPYVFTPANPTFEIQDESLLRDVPKEAEIIRFPIWEPYSLFNKVSGKKKTGSFVSGGEKASLFHQLSTWVRGNFFIPDPRRFWVRPSVKFLASYLAKNNITTIITTGPPHSIHLIGLGLKKKNPSLKWLADFRDPWSEWGFLDSLKVGSFAKSIHRKLEEKVLQTADEIITITPFYVRQFERLSGKNVNLLTNGFDEDDFLKFTVKNQNQFLIRHIGIVNEKCDPRPFMLAVADLCDANSEIAKQLKVEFVGSVHPSFREFVGANPKLSSVTIFTQNVPHQALMDIYASSSILVLVLTGYKDAEGYLPGKLFEYLATGLPILGVGPVDGDAAFVINNAQAGVMCASHDASGIEKFLKDFFLNWKESDGKSKVGAIEKYSRKKITGDLVNLLKRI